MTYQSAYSSSVNLNANPEPEQLLLQGKTFIPRPPEFTAIQWDGDTVSADQISAQLSKHDFDLKWRSGSKFEAKYSLTGNVATNGHTAPVGSVFVISNGWNHKQLRRD